MVADDARKLVVHQWSKSIAIYVVKPRPQHYQDFSMPNHLQFISNIGSYKISFRKCGASIAHEAMGNLFTLLHRLLHRFNTKRPTKVEIRHTDFEQRPPSTPLNSICGWTQLPAWLSSVSNAPISLQLQQHPP